MDISMLKEALGDALYAQAEEKLSAVEGLLVIATDDGTWLPKGRLDAEIARRREAQETAERLNAQLDECRSALEEAAELRRQLAAQQRGEAVREALRAAHARDAALVEKLLSPDGDIDAQIAALRAHSPYLFADEPARCRGGFGGSRLTGPEGCRYDDVNSAIRTAAGRG